MRKRRGRGRGHRCSRMHRLDFYLPTQSIGEIDIRVVSVSSYFTADPERRGKSRERRTHV